MGPAEPQQLLPLVGIAVVLYSLSKCSHSQDQPPAYQSVLRVVQGLLGDQRGRLPQGKAHTAGARRSSNNNQPLPTPAAYP